MLFVTLNCDVTAFPGSVERFRKTGERVRLTPVGGASVGGSSLGAGVGDGDWARTWEVLCLLPTKTAQKTKIT